MDEVDGVKEVDEEDVGAGDAGDVGVSAGAEVGVDGFAAGVSIAIGVLSSAVGERGSVSSTIGVVVVFVVVPSVIGVESENRNVCCFGSVCQSMR